MNTYSYWDHNHVIWVKPSGKQLHGHYESPLVFTCVDECITKADKQFEDALNNGRIKLKPKDESHGKLLAKTAAAKKFDVTKMSHIACTIGKAISGEGWEGDESYDG